MLKREMVWRYIADEALEGKRSTFHQSEMASELGMSVGNVNLALEPLRSIGAVEVVGKNLVVRDIKKVLMLWGARRAQPEILAAFASQESPRDLLKILPNGLALTSFAGFIERYHEEPAPLSVVRAYARPGDRRLMDELGRRFTRARDLSRATLVVYAADTLLAARLLGVVGPAQMFVDLWNEADFFASDYLRVLEGKLRL